MKWTEGYKIKNQIKTFEETKKLLEKTQFKRMKLEVELLKELQDTLDGHDCHLSPNDGCECYKVRQEIKDLKERLHDEIISNETDDLLLSARC